MMKEQVTVIFDAAGGGITVSNKRVVRGEPYGSLPTPSRFGYEFDGWFTAEVGGEKVDAETIVSAEASHPLYAHWTKNDYTDKIIETKGFLETVGFGGKMVLIGMLTVFAILGIIFVCLTVFKYVFTEQKKEKAITTKEVVVEESSAPETCEYSNDEEIIAVIAAAIAMAEDENQGAKFRVVSFKRR